jgi:hypothetical protein
VLIAANIDSDKAKVLENSKDIRKEITKSDNLRNRVKLATVVVDFVSFSELYICCIVSFDLSSSKDSVFDFMIFNALSPIFVCLITQKVHV